MGGVIGCSGVPGAGATFWFTVPFEKRTASRLAVSAAKASFSNARVLILGEGETSTRVISHYLTGFGMRPRPSRTIEEGIERMQNEAAMGDLSI